MRRLRAPIHAALPLVVAVCVVLACQVDALASGPDLVDARLQGAWNLDVTVASYAGPQQLGNRPVGHKAADRIWFESTCPAPGLCNVRIWGPTGPDPSQAAYFQYFSNASGFEGTPGPTGLQQSQTTYSVTIPIGGFGGFKCSPPPGNTRPGQTLTLKVVDAKKNGAGWLATTVTGTEVLNAGWGCNGAQATGWIAQTLSIIGHPVGYVAPAAQTGSAGLRVSSLAGALNTPQRAFRSPALLVANLVVTALVIVFVTFPSALFNHTLSENYAEITGVLRRLRSFVTRLRRDLAQTGGASVGRRQEFVIFAGVLLLGSVIDGLLDPGFGFNGTSAISYVATVVTLVFGVATSGMVALAYRRARHRETNWYLNALPLGLVVAAACVLVSRVTDFQPGYFYGLVCGIAFGTQLAKQERGHTAAASVLTTMTFAVVAWFFWSLVHPHTSGAPWPVILVDDFLASVFVGGLVGNVIALLPLRSLQGGALIAWHRGVWAVVFAVAVFGLVQVLLHPEQGAVHPSQAPLLTALVLFVGFGGSSLAFNRYFAWKGRPTRHYGTAETTEAEVDDRTPIQKEGLEKPLPELALHEVAGSEDVDGLRKNRPQDG